MKRKLYLHIGLLKTATTTIQRELIAHRETLLTKCNYLLPYDDSFYDYTNGCFRFAGLLIDNHDIAVPKPSLHSVFDIVEASDSPNIIISDEKFSLMRDEHVQDLQVLCADYDTKIIVYMRRQDSYLQSLWAQWTKMGINTLEFQSWLQSELQHAENIHYDRIINRWATYFGQENIIVRPFEKDQLNSNIVVDFLQCCGITDLDWVSEPSNYNTSPGLYTVETIRHVLQNQTELLPQLANTPSMPARIAYKIREYAEMNDWDSTKFNLVDGVTFATIMEHVTEGNQHVAKQYLDQEQLFSLQAPKHDITELSQPITIDDNLLQYIGLLRLTQQNNVVLSYLRKLFSKMPMLRRFGKKILAWVLSHRR